MNIIFFDIVKLTISFYFNFLEYVLQVIVHYGPKMAKINLRNTHQIYG